MNVLITGASGFIGKNLVKNLENICTVFCHSRNEIPLSVPNIYQGININGQSNWKNSLRDIDVVVHLAAVAHNNSNDIDYINSVNVDGTINLAKQAASSGVKRFIFISTIGVHGSNSYSGLSISETSSIDPCSEYASSKFKAERELTYICSKYNLELVIIRPVLVYGPSAPGNFKKLVGLINKFPFLPFGLINNKRSFLSVDNLVDFINLCISHPKAANEVFCVCDDSDISVKELITSVSLGFNKKIYQVPVPKFFFTLFGFIFDRMHQVDQLVGDLQVDCSKAKVLLNWKPPVKPHDALSRVSK